MKVAFVHKKYTSYGGTERFMTNLSAALLNEGHEVTVYANKWVAPYDERITFIKVPMLKGLKLFKVASFAMMAHSKVDSELYDIVQGFGKTVKQDVFRTGGGCHKAWQKESLLSLGNPLLRSLKYLRRLLSINQWLALAIEGRTFRKGNYKKIISPSKRVKAQIMELYGVPGSDIAVVYNGVDLTRFNCDDRDAIKAAIRGKYGVKDDETLLTFAATNFKLKGLEYIMRAVGRLKERKLKLMVIGGSKQKKFIELARALGIADKVVFTGVADNMSELYKAGDIFIYPTFYDPFANTCLEAIACGLPVITSRVNGFSEILDDGVSGLLLDDPADDAEMAQKIKRLLDDKTLRGDMSRRGIELSKKYTKEYNARCIMDIYEVIRRLK